MDLDQQMESFLRAYSANAKDYGLISKAVLIPYLFFIEYRLKLGCVRPVIDNITIMTSVSMQLSFRELAYRNDLVGVRNGNLREIDEESYVQSLIQEGVDVWRGDAVVPVNVFFPNSPFAREAGQFMGYR